MQPREVHQCEFDRCDLARAKKLCKLEDGPEGLVFDIGWALYDGVLGVKGCRVRSTSVPGSSGLK